VNTADQRQKTCCAVCCCVCEELSQCSFSLRQYCHCPFDCQYFFHLQLVCADNINYFTLIEFHISRSLLQPVAQSLSLPLNRYSNVCVNVQIVNKMLRSYLPLRVVSLYILVPAVVQLSGNISDCLTDPSTLFCPETSILNRIS